MNRSIGILGGGQLGRMMYESVIAWDVDMNFMDKDRTFPVGKICPKFEEGDFNDFDNVLQFGNRMDVISIEIENVNTEALFALEEQGKKCFPQAAVLNIIKDKGLQKQYYKAHNFPTSDFGLYTDREAILSAIKNGAIVFPFVQKARTEGYDGRGVQLIYTENGLNKIMDVPSVIEDKVDILKELSVIVARNEKGQVEVFPTVEMVINPSTNQLDYQLCPASISIEEEKQARLIAIELVEKWNMVGLLAIELFLTADGNILINEVAPRPHNSGHHTIEACNVSQFEQLSRCLLGLDLIRPRIKHPSVMVNLVGSEGHIGPAIYQGMEELLKDDQVYIHLYGKEITKPNRKMGHITIIDESIDKAIHKSEFVKDTITVITKPNL